MTEDNQTDSEAKAEQRAAKREARAELKARATAEARKTREALVPLSNRIQVLVQEYEDCASFDHARRMSKLLHGFLRAVEIACQEAEKDLARISDGESPCQPSVVRQRLSDFLWDTQ